MDYSNLQITKDMIRWYEFRCFVWFFKFFSGLFRFLSTLHIFFFWIKSLLCSRSTNFKTCWDLWLPKSFPTSAHLSEIFVIFGETKTFPKFFKNFYCICHDLLILCFKKFISTFFFVCFLYCFHNSTTTTRKNSWC